MAIFHSELPCPILFLISQLIRTTILRPLLVYETWRKLLSILLLLGQKRRDSANNILLLSLAKKYSEIFSPPRGKRNKILRDEIRRKIFDYPISFEARGRFLGYERGREKVSAFARGHFFDPFGRRCLLVSPTLTSWFAAARAINYNPCPSLFLSLPFFSQNFTIEPRIMWGENLMASRTVPREK